MADKDMYCFTFTSLREEGDTFPSSKSVQFDVEFDDGVPWTSVVDEFFNFLSSIYGYHCDPKKYAARFEPTHKTSWDDE